MTRPLFCSFVVILLVMCGPGFIGNISDICINELFICFTTKKKSFTKDFFLLKSFIVEY